MATLIPAMLRSDSPPGEAAVFDALRDHPATADWVVFHGLPIRHHETQIQGEADFVLLIPEEGMLVVEVKSHLHVEVGEDGLWRMGKQAPTRRSPYEQADANSQSIRKWIARRGYVAPYPIWHAVWFPNCGGELVKRLEGRIDVTPKSTLTRADLDPAKLVNSLVGVMRHGRSEVERRTRAFLAERPDAQDIEEARATLVPSLRFEAAVAERRAQRERDLREATERQEAALRYFGANRQLIVEGPAGTGKTNVAVRAAQQAANREEQVLLTCFNQRLGAELKQRLSTRDDIDVARVHQLMLSLTGLTPPPGADNAWWNDTLPAATLAITQAPGYEPPYTCLVADEAQDLARDTTLDVLDSVLVGGLSGARVILAGDFTRQDIFTSGRLVEPQPGSDGPQVETTSLARIHSRLTSPAVMTLTNNVRQTPQLAEAIEAMLNDEVYDAFDRKGDDSVEPPLSIHRYETDAEQSQLLNDTLAALWEEGWDQHEILVLSPRRRSAASHLKGPSADALAYLGRDSPGTPWGTIHAHKGLESPVVVLTDIDGSRPQWEDLFYIGATRATERLVVITSLGELGAGMSEG